MVPRLIFSQVCVSRRSSCFIYSRSANSVWIPTRTRVTFSFTSTCQKTKFPSTTFNKNKLNSWVTGRTIGVLSKNQPLILRMATASSLTNISQSHTDSTDAVSESVSVLTASRPSAESTSKPTEMENNLCAAVQAAEKPDNEKGDKNEQDCASVAKSNIPANISQLSKRAQKKFLRMERLKEQKKAKRAQAFTRNSNPGFDNDIFGETDFYFENGLRKVYPYPYTFSTYAKERWYGRTLQDIFETEFRLDSLDNYKKSGSKYMMKVNGKTVGLDYAVKNNDFIENVIHRHENPVSGMPIEILEDTDDVVVINKPASIPCHPCGKYRFNSIVFIMGKEYGYANLRNIYRLDRLTSGVLILGKTARKTKELENQVLHRQVQKEYVARVVGEFPKEEVTVDHPLDCLSHKLTLWRVVHTGGKPSSTTFQRLSYNGQTSLVKCIPHTGRTHQIRVHLQYLGHPIVNDPYYNSPSWGPLRGKGGHCDISYEELCQQITQEHNVGLWCDGENPLFQQRLSKAQTSEQTSLDEDKHPAPIETKSNTDDFVTPNTKDERELHCDQSFDNVSPPAKKPRLDPGIACTDKKSTDGDEVENVNIVQKSKPNMDDSSSDIKMDHSSLKTKMDHISSSTCEKEQERRISLERKGFEPQRWVPDPLCESCRRNYIDPKPTDLLLYLHALRYQGPTWDYSTSLPEWADENWEEPEEYKKKYLS